MTSATPTMRRAARAKSTPAVAAPAIKPQPLHDVRWVKPSTLRANNYNPNRVFSPELRLLKISLLSSGWTQPIVAQHSGEIVDGFHRWTLGRTDKAVMALTGGLVPVVFLPKTTDDAEQKMATIRHNRARGKHSVLLMAKIVRDLRDQGMGNAEIQELLQMESEEVDRMLDVRTSPDGAGANAFGKGWVPDKA